MPDLPDPRDYACRDAQVSRLLQRLKASRAKNLPEKTNLRYDDEGEYFTPPEDQGELNCSSACAVLGLVGYFERRVHGHTFEGSTLFLYKAARKLLRTTGDCGADLRTTFKSLRRFGVPPAELWHSDPARFDDEPCDPCLIGYARDYQRTCYVRLDARDAKLRKNPNAYCALGSQTLRTVKSFLAAGFPVALGFSVPKSLSAESRIPYRPSFDSIRGGQAVLAVGYDDRKDTSPRGAILIRSSWGESWGDAGYGWLPYAYVRQQLAKDFWTLLRKDWMDSDEFSVPSVVAAEISLQRRTVRDRDRHM